MPAPTIRSRLRRLEQLSAWRPPNRGSAWSAQEQHLVATDPTAKALAEQAQEVMRAAFFEQPELQLYQDDHEQMLGRMATPILQRLHDALEKLHARLDVLRGQSAPTNARNPEAIHGTS